MPPAAPSRMSKLNIISLVVAYLNFFGSLAIALLLLIKAIQLGLAMKKYNSYLQVDVAVLVMMCVLLVIMVLDLVFVVALIIGLNKSKPGYLKGYMIFSALLLVIFVADFIATVVLFGMVTVTFGLFHWFPFAIIVCFILVIKLRYDQMKERAREPATCVYYAT